MNVLAVGCHPDDLEIACFGTLARCVQRGDKVTICHIANGIRGHVVIDPVRLREIRREEAIEAGRRIGAEVCTLDVPDLEVNSRDYEQIKALTELVRKIKPDFIITHSPQDYMQDPQEVQKRVFDASNSASIHNQEDRPAGVAKITDKLEALNCHHSQIDLMREHDHIDFLDFVKTCSKYRGLQCGVGYAEGFQTVAVWPRQPVQRLLP